MRLKKYLILPDAHVPFVNKIALLLALAVGKFMKVDTIIILGDFADIYSCNSYGKKSRLMHLNLKKEMRSVNKWLDFIDRHFPKANKVYIEGNHEDRIRRKVEKDAIEFDGFVDFYEAAKLHTRKKWTFVPFTSDQLYKVGGTSMHVRHCPYSNTSANASIKKSMISVIFGHTHRREYIETRDGRGKKLIQCSAGFLGDRKNKDIFGYAADRKSLGFHMLYEYPDGEYTLEQVNINDEKNDLVFGGKRFYWSNKKVRMRDV